MGYTLMIQRFRHKGLERFFKTGYKGGIQPHQANRLRLILTALNQATQVNDMGLPGLQLHRLRGHLQGFWSVSVSGNWRVMFRFEEGDVFDVDLIDYH